MVSPSKPPHAELLNGIENLTNAEEKIAFLHQATNRIVRSKECSCCYCEYESDNPLLVFEKALLTRDQLTDVNPLQSDAKEAELPLLDPFQELVNNLADCPSKPLGKDMSVSNTALASTIHNEPTRRLTIQQEMERIRKNSVKTGARDGRRPLLSPFSFSQSPDGKMMYHDNVNATGPGVPVPSEQRQLAASGNHERSKPQLDYGPDGQRAILAQEIIRRSKPRSAPNSRPASPYQQPEQNAIALSEDTGGSRPKASRSKRSSRIGKGGQVQRPRKSKVSKSITKLSDHKTPLPSNSIRHIPESSCAPASASKSSSQGQYLNDDSTFLRKLDPALFHSEQKSQNLSGNYSLTQPQRQQLEKSKNVAPLSHVNGSAAQNSTASTQAGGAKLSELDSTHQIVHAPESVQSNVSCYTLSTPMKDSSQPRLNNRQTTLPCKTLPRMRSQSAPGAHFPVFKCDTTAPQQQPRLQTQQGVSQLFPGFMQRTYPPQLSAPFPPGQISHSLQTARQAIQPDFAQSPPRPRTLSQTSPSTPQSLRNRVVQGKHFIVNKYHQFIPNKYLPSTSDTSSVVPSSQGTPTSASRTRQSPSTQVKLTSAATTAPDFIASAHAIGPVAANQWPAPTAPLRIVAPNVWIDRAGIKWTRNWSGEWERYRGS